MNLSWRYPPPGARAVAQPAPASLFHKGARGKGNWNLASIPEISRIRPLSPCGSLWERAHGRILCYCTSLGEGSLDLSFFLRDQVAEEGEIDGARLREGCRVGAGDEIADCARRALEQMQHAGDHSVGYGKLAVSK